MILSMLHYLSYDGFETSIQRKTNIILLNHKLATSYENQRRADIVRSMYLLFDLSRLLLQIEDPWRKGFWQHRIY